MRQKPSRRSLALLLALGSFGYPDPFPEGARANPAPTTILPDPQICQDVDPRVMINTQRLSLTSAWRQYHLTSPTPSAPLAVGAPTPPYRVGALWSGSALRVDLKQRFSIEAWLYLSDQAASAAGEGIAFVLHNDQRGTAAIGAPGLGHGASDSLSADSPPVATAGLRRSLVVEFDTRRNAEAGPVWSDPAGDHVAMFLDGDGRHADPAFPAPYVVPGGLRGAGYHFFRFSWDPVSRKFQAYVNHRRAQELVLPNPAGHFGSDLLTWGFAASASDPQNQQRLCFRERTATPTADYGDAPASYGHAWHMRPTHLAHVHMGPQDTAAARPDSEAGSRHDALAGLNGSGDVVAREAPFIPNNPSWSGGYLPLRGWGGGSLSAWIDWNRDGVFSPEEQVVKDVADEDPEDVRRGPDNFMQVFAPPRADLMTGGAGPSFIRMRWSTQRGLDATGEAPDGEVEDHAFRLALPQTRDCGTQTGGGFATSGQGRYKSDVFWLDWSCGVAQFNAGDVVAKTWILPSGLRLTGRLHDVRGSMRPYQLGQNPNDSLRRLYQGPGWVGLANSYQNSLGNSPYVGFSLTLELRNAEGALLPYDLTTVASELEVMNADEQFSLTTSGAPWSAVDGEGSPSASFSADGRSAAQHSAGSLILASPGGSRIDVLLGPNAVSPSVAAFGVFVPTDYGDAPQSYGPAGHVQQVLFAGGDRPSVPTPMTAAQFAERLPTSLLLGRRLDVEPAPLHSPGATGDDLSGEPDEDGAAFPKTDPAGTPLLRGREPQRISVEVQGAGHLSAWIDWSRDGVFTEDERVAQDLVDGGPGDEEPEAGKIAFLVDPPEGYVVGPSFLRLRWSPSPGAGPALSLVGGEAEDRAVSLEPPRPLADVELSFSAVTREPVFGMAAELIMTAENKGPEAAVGLEVFYQPPPGHLLQSHEAAEAAYDPASGLWSAGGLEPGASKRLRLTLQPVATPPALHEAEIRAHEHLDPDSIPGNGPNAEDDYATILISPRIGLGGSAPPACPAETAALDWSAVAPIQAGGLIEASFPFAGALARLRLQGGQRAGRPRAVGSGAASALELAQESRILLVFEFSRPVSGLRLPLRGLEGSGPDSLEGIRALGRLRGASRIPQIAAGALVSVSGEFAVGAPHAAPPPGAHDLTLWFDGEVDALALDVTGFLNGAEGPWELEMGALSACLPPASQVVSLRPDHESAVPPGQLAIYPHHLTIAPRLDGSALEFEVVSEAGLAWTIRRDDGDGVFDAQNDPVWIPGALIGEGSFAFWAVAQVPQEAPAGWRDLTRIRARISSPGAGPFVAEAQDLTRVGGDREGQIHAVKSVALDADCDGSPDLGEGGFLPILPVAEASCVIYRISFENRSVTPISHVRVHDQTPEWTTYVGASARTEVLPPGLGPPSLEQPAPGGEGPVVFDFEGALIPGARGLVRFGVKLSGAAPPSAEPPPALPN